MKYKGAFVIILTIFALLAIAGVNASAVNEVATDGNSSIQNGLLQIDENMLEDNIESNPKDSQVMTQVNDDIISEPDSGTFRALKSKIDNAEPDSEIMLENDYTYNTGSGVNGINIDKSMTIDGQGYAIDCSGNSYYLFTSDKGEVTLKNLIIKNSKNDYNKLGGAIFIKGSAQWTIINCTFESNVAKNYGGAIYNNVDETLTIINSTFKNNKADNENGGAIFSKGKVVVEGSYFEANTALVDAGAIYCEKSVEVSDSIFINNRASGAKVHKCYGGAICAKENIEVENSTFSKNAADNYGGAIYAHKDLMVTGSSFAENSAKEGGAIYGSGSHVFVDDSTFIKNAANSNRGGAIYADKWLHLGDSGFEYNTAQGRGGAVYTDFVKFDGSNSFIQNSAKGHGGAIYTSTIADKISNIVFDGNHADDDYGGALYINNKCGDVYFYNATFLSNHAIAGDGGAIYSDSSSTRLILYDSTFNSNYARGGYTKRYGGAICSKGDINVNNCSFNYNWAENYGGAIYCYGSLTSEGNSIFVANEVTNDGGGAIYTEKLTKLMDTSFVSCSAKSNGGAIYINAINTIRVSNCYFKSNHARNYGGAIYTNQMNSNLFLYNNAFIGNTADNQGSDVFCYGKYGQVSNNWWGTNSPSFSGQKLIEYKVFGSNKKHSDSNPVKVTLSCLNDGVNYLPTHFKVTFSNTVPAYLVNDVELSSNSAGAFKITAVGINAFEFDYTPYNAGDNRISVRINSQLFTYNLNVKKTSVAGEDFSKVYGKAGAYSAVFLDSEGNFLLNGTVVKFNVDGVGYEGVVHENGVASLYANLDVGMHTVEAVNLVTGESYTNQITILPEAKKSTFNINDSYFARFVIDNDESISGGIATFTIAGSEYKSNVTSYGWALLRLDVAPGNYVITASYRNVTMKDNITVLNQYSKVASHLNGTTYGSLVPVYNNESFVRVDNVTYSIIGENTYRYVSPSSEAFILYNVTVSNSNELTEVLRKMSKNDYNVDVTIINLEKGTYKVTENFWRDQEWYYLLHLTHGKLFINGNGATIEDGYYHNFIYGNPNTVISIRNLTVKTFYRCFVNYGELYCANTTFIKNDPRFFDTATFGGVVYNLNKATFDNCTFDNNRNSEPIGGWQTEEGTLGGVLYAETNSFTNFITCKFLSKHDNIHASDKSAIVFYDVDNTNFEFHKYNSYLGMLASIGVRNVSGLNSNTSHFLNYHDTESLLNVHNDIKGISNASGYVINLENRNYVFDQDDYKRMIDSREEWRTNILNPDYIYIPQKDRGILDMDSRAIVVNGHGATVHLEKNSVSNDYHFAVVPKHSSLTLVNLTLSGFNSAILNYGTLFIVNCTFKDNAYRTAFDYDHGGAIKNYGGIYCYNSTFIGNKASKGGAIYSEGVSAQALFVNCEFSKNKLETLKSILIAQPNSLHVTQNSAVRLVNCSIYDSDIKTDEDGLVLMRDDADLFVYNVVVDSVTSLMRLSNLIRDNEEYDIINVTFVKGDYGVFPDSNLLFEMDYGKLIINGEGARIFVQNAKNKDETRFLSTTIRSYVVIHDLIIEGFNIAIENSGYLEIYGSQFINNKVNYLVKNDYGGAIVNKGTLNVFNSTFKGNYAKYGGAIYNTGRAAIVISTFNDNTGYDKKSNVDVYTHEGNVKIISIGNTNPKTVEHFPMTQWQEDLLKSAIYLVTAIVVSAASYSTANNGISHWVATAIGAAIGGSFGAVHGAIYSDSHQDYGTFWTKVFEGVSNGIEFVGIGEAISEFGEPPARLDVYTREGWLEVLDNLLDEFVSRSWEFVSGYIDDEYLAGPPDDEIDVIYVPTILQGA